MHKFKNNKATADVWCGQSIEPAAYYEIQPGELLKWQNDSKVLSDIGSGDGVMNDGTADITDVAQAINFLKNLQVREVVTQLEKDDKGLRTFCAFQTTDEAGEAEFCIPIPQPKRFIAYGDSEFEVRHFGDYVKHIEVTDLDRLIAWQVALAMDPEATEPVADAVIQAMTAEQLGNGPFPQYPSLGAYEERSFPNPMPANAKGDIRAGMAMTFQYGITASEPVGGYGELPGGMYFRIVAQKASDAPTLQGQTGKAGYRCQLSIDWAEQVI